MSFGSVTPILMLAFAAVIVVGVIVRLVVASRQRRTRAELRTIGSAITGAGAAQSSAYGWAPTSLAPLEGPAVGDESDAPTADEADDRAADQGGRG